MSEGRHKLEEIEEDLLRTLKNHISIYVKELLESGVRPANIEIELIHHIKGLLKKD